jgi:uncharacterized membrane protein YgdD (TMEM256/DUF423 family)
MANENKLMIVIGCFFLAAAGALAAFGFHGPADILTPEKRASWAWAVDMQYYHAGGLVLTGILGHLLGVSWFMRAAAFLMLAGMLVFSCLFYINTFGLLTSLSPVIPTGGSMLMLSWIALAIGVLRAG